MYCSLDSLFYASTQFRDSPVLYQSARIQNSEHGTFIQFLIILNSQKI